MRVLRVQQLASELDLLPGDLNVMITVGRMAALAQSINVPDYATRVEISSASDEYVMSSRREEIKEKLELALMDYFYTYGSSSPNFEEIAELCLSILESTPRIS